MKKLFVVIDMQNDFITGALGNEDCQAVVPRVIEEINKAKSEGYDLFYTQDTHEPDYLDTQEGTILPVEHCIHGTNGWNVREDVMTALGFASHVNKDTFGSTGLGAFVLNEKYKEVILVGVCTDICVISNAMIIRAFSPETKISVIASACAGVTPERHEIALKAMEACQVTVIR